MSVCQTPGCVEHYGCRLRGKGVQFDATVVPKHKHDPGPFRPIEQPSWEAGVAVETRADGTQMPILRIDESGTAREMHVKEYAENRHQVNEDLRNNARLSAPKE